jgi:phosphoglycolate phosphatase-like HAD superfamily hydrolase
VKDRRTLFWDFDGVIKDSVTVKSDAYEQLFVTFGAHVAARVREHHERNGGMSRYEKIPLYLEWAGRKASAAEVSRYCERFSTAVSQAVIDSPWVPGAREYLQANHIRQCFFLVTATPQAEIEAILAALDLLVYFREVHGAPTSKADAIVSVLGRWKLSCTDALLIGDSESDFAAANKAGVDFLLRRTALNSNLQRRYSGQQCEDFTHG